MKKLIQVVTLLLALTILVIIAIPVPEVETFDEPLVWEKTVSIKSNPVPLLQLVVRETPWWDKAKHDSTIQLSYEDAQLLMKIAAAESANQGYEGMLKVMTVIINRTESEKFPNTIFEVVSQKNAFESYANGSYLTAEITPECHMALATIEKNKDLEKNLYAFENKNNGNKLEQWFDVVCTYKDHTFYTIKND